MKNFNLFNWQILIFIILLLSFPCYAQVNWYNIDIAGKEAKILKIPTRLRLTLSVNASSTVAKTQDKIINSQEMHNALNNELMHETLMEKFSGFYFLSNSTNPTNANDIKLKGESSDIVFGAQISKSLSNRLEAGVGIKFFEQYWNGTFPVTVIPFDETQQSYSTNGNIESSASYFLLNTNGTYYLWPNKISPFITAGIQFAVPGKSNLTASLQGVPLQLNKNQEDITVSAFGGAGVRFIFLKHFFAKVALGVNKFPSQQYAPLIQVGIGGGI